MHATLPKLTLFSIALATSTLGCIATPDDGGLGESGASGGAAGATDSGGSTHVGGKPGTSSGGSSPTSSGGSSSGGAPSGGTSSGGAGATGATGGGGTGSGGAASGGGGGSGGVSNTGGTSGGSGGACSCDVNSWCDPGCSCDTACTGQCPCDFGAGCNTGCACDELCYQPKGPTSSACTTLSLPSATTASIDASDPVYNDLPHDSYCVTLSAGNKLTVQTGPTNNAIDDTFVTLSDGSGKLLTYDDDSAGNFFSKLEFVAPSAGTYVISVFPLNSLVTGDYSLNISAQ